MNPSPTPFPIAPNFAVGKDAQKLLPTPIPVYALFGCETSEAVGCSVGVALPEQAFVFLEVCLGYHEPFLYTSQDLFVLELVNL